MLMFFSEGENSPLLPWVSPPPNAPQSIISLRFIAICRILCYKKTSPYLSKGVLFHTEKSEKKIKIVVSNYIFFASICGGPCCVWKQHCQTYFWLSNCNCGVRSQPWFYHIPNSLKGIRTMCEFSSVKEKTLVHSWAMSITNNRQTLESYISIWYINMCRILHYPKRINGRYASFIQRKWNLASAADAQPNRTINWYFAMIQQNMGHISRCKNKPWSSNARFVSHSKVTKATWNDRLSAQNRFGILFFASRFLLWGSLDIGSCFSGSF